MPQGGENIEGGGQKRMEPVFQHRNPACVLHTFCEYSASINRLTKSPNGVRLPVQVDCIPIVDVLRIFNIPFLTLQIS